MYYQKKKTEKHEKKQKAVVYLSKLKIFLLFYEYCVLGNYRDLN